MARYITYMRLVEVHQTVHLILHLAHHPQALLWPLLPQLLQLLAAL